MVVDTGSVWVTTQTYHCFFDNMKTHWESQIATKKGVGDREGGAFQLLWQRFICNGLAVAQATAHAQPFWAEKKEILRGFFSMAWILRRVLGTHQKQYPKGGGVPGLGHCGPEGGFPLITVVPKKGKGRGLIL